jgi:hypothetical protein
VNSFGRDDVTLPLTPRMQRETGFLSSADSLEQFTLHMEWTRNVGSPDGHRWMFR